MHEDFSRTEEVESSSNRSFGLVIGVFFLLVAFGPLLREPSGTPRWWALALSIIFVVLALLNSALLTPFNKLWTKFGLLMFKVVSPIVLALLFYTTITPIGLLMRAVGKDPLRLHRIPVVQSYWIPREPPGPPPESMKNQF